MFIAGQKEYTHKMKIAGKYYGYNDCCIDSFIKRHTKEVAGDQTQEFFGSGFVPCRKCLENKSPKVIREEINQKRVHNIPFDKGFNTNETIELNLIKNSNKFSKDEYLILKKYSLK